ncbi:saccharopine dehydrogenase [Vannielia litorea]|uniref:Saccharopine dehydrogenase [NAD(+), L-lysine-forming] n=1 Tax=Vannielia litorea TaxID=1217970 RepID=A0A1N6H4N3_9RHOB|nr:saccharopine dehydrogenase [Vannielia litorea]SIO14778.1 saccharopine dehydrogenase (NAD+, L-lysine-forming) [Vannielia litorea]
MVHLWVRAEERENERRVGLVPEGVEVLKAQGIHVTVEESPDRIIPIAHYREAGAEIAPRGSWREAPADALIYGLKELPEDGTPLAHRHIMFGHAYKGQPAGQALLKRFGAGGGMLYDLEYLTDETGRRVAAFGYWAGFVGAAVTLKAWAAAQRGEICGPVKEWEEQGALVREVAGELDGLGLPQALIVGALGRVGTGAGDMCAAIGIEPLRWDIADTAAGGPFPEILRRDIFLNCVLAGPNTPIFVPREAAACPRGLTAIGDISCDPTSDFNPVPVYDAVTSWAAPVRRVAETPVLDVMAIDNLPSLLPKESSEDFAGQMLPHLLRLSDTDKGVWGRAEATFMDHMA